MKKLIKNPASKYFLLPGLSRKRMGKNVYYFLIEIPNPNPKSLIKSKWQMSKKQIKQIQTRNTKEKINKIKNENNSTYHEPLSR